MHDYLVSEVKNITPSTILLGLKRDENERPIAFQPGQYAAINFEKRGKKSAVRCFSIVSSPTDQDELKFSMRVRGRFTTKLSKLEEGTVVNIRGPFGGFIYDVNRDKEAIFIAGGIGITPFMSMMTYCSKLNTDNKITLLYSVQDQNDIAFKEDLLNIEKNNPNIKTIFVVGNGPIDKLNPSNAATGRIDANLMDKYSNSDYTNKKFFICGPPGFMKAMVSVLASKGVDSKRILTEAFTQSSPKQSSILRSWPANVYAIGLVGIVLGSLIIMVGDLLRILPPKSSGQPTKNSPYYLTNAKQKQIDSLVNSIPPSPLVITAPTNPTQTSSSSSTPSSSIVNSTPPTFAPIYLSAPAPKTTASIPPP